MTEKGAVRCHMHISWDHNCILSVHKQKTPKLTFSSQGSGPPEVCWAFSLVRYIWGSERDDWEEDVTRLCWGSSGGPIVGISGIIGKSRRSMKPLVLVWKYMIYPGIGCRYNFALSCLSACMCWCKAGSLHGLVFMSSYTESFLESESTVSKTSSSSHPPINAVSWASCIRTKTARHFCKTRQGASINSMFFCLRERSVQRISSPHVLLDSPSHYEFTYACSSPSCHAMPAHTRIYPSADIVRSPECRCLLLIRHITSTRWTPWLFLCLKNYWNPPLPGIRKKAWTSTENAKFQELCARFDEVTS